VLKFKSLQTNFEFYFLGALDFPILKGSSKLSKVVDPILKILNQSPILFKLVWVGYCELHLQYAFSTLFFIGVISVQTYKTM
jgi:hypothetical protein